jgi:hypothetical protein
MVGVPPALAPASPGSLVAPALELEPALPLLSPALASVPPVLFGSVTTSPSLHAVTTAVAQSPTATNQRAL